MNIRQLSLLTGAALFALLAQDYVAQAAQAFVAPNHYRLSGGGISVTYTPSGGPVTTHGPGHFTYHDAHLTLNFSGDQIRRLDVPDLGTVVSVTLIPTVDTGSTTFSVLLPAVNLPGVGASAPIHTDGITTVHKFSLIPGFNQGQREQYKVTALSGTASNVIVPL